LISAKNIYLKPDTLKGATEYASQNKDSFKYVAGGTDIFANRFQGNETSVCLIDISGIKELLGCKIIDGY
jgi:CO/xanthine dehydrogenase FAD-binding subunit